MRKYVFCILCILVVFMAALAVTADTTALTELADVCPLPDGGTAYLDFYKSPSGGNGILLGRTIEDPALLRAAPFYRISAVRIFSSKHIASASWYFSIVPQQYPNLCNDSLWGGGGESPKSAKAVCVQFSRDGDIEVGVLSISKSK